MDEIGIRGPTFIVRNFAYKPIVVQSNEKFFKKFVTLRVTEIKSNYLMGELKNESSVTI